MNKGKTAQSTLTEMHFVSSLPLKKAVKLLDKLSTPETPVTLTETHSDLWQFELVYHPADEDAASAIVKGTLRRWEGTLTRLDCTGDVYRETRRGLPQFARPTGQTAMAMLVVGGVLLLILNMTHEPLVIMSAGVMIALIAAAGTAGNLARGLLDAGEHEPVDQVFFRERDYLLQLLIDSFKAESDVSIDGDGLREKTPDVDYAALVLKQRRRKNAAQRR